MTPLGYLHCLHSYQLVVLEQPCPGSCPGDCLSLHLQLCSFQPVTHMLTLNNLLSLKSAAVSEHSCHMKVTDQWQHGSRQTHMWNVKGEGGGRREGGGCHQVTAAAVPVFSHSTLANTP